MPWKGIHPTAGLNRARDPTLGQPPALHAIGEEAGIELGWYPGSAIPFVATTDLVIRIGNVRRDRLVFWSVKPLRELRDSKSGPRVRERIELERRYAVTAGAAHSVFTDKHVNDHLRKNLMWLTPCREHIEENPPSSREAFLECFRRQPDS